MKTLNVTLIVAVLLQISIVTGLTAQQSANAYPKYRINKVKELIATNHKFEVAKHRNYFMSNLDDQKALQSWMLNPAEWSNIAEKESTDPQLELKDWMLNPTAMTTNNNEESIDTAIVLQDWMLDPAKMSVDGSEDVQLEAWMLNPTKW
ncbi:MAG TPA: hypothetical protein VHO72_00105 [Bacteroidales bacterium]|nr:hypothetical protein [Bacteroidales bacterium]